MSNRETLHDIIWKRRRERKAREQAASGYQPMPSDRLKLVFEQEHDLLVIAGGEIYSRQNASDAVFEELP